ncbi:MULTISPECIES: sensor histidine kinase [Streptomyces]|uniref:histidine kinase n=1 Tax=Streptomyces virginiae TaxID=1961 RepID=A0ABQ3NKI9_STRVG|nr:MULTISPECIES: histidine kinase [Streptomyces]KOV15928.1 histidine kinase [Streptomyces sp. XY511]MBP2342825.1 signal transduction histidine kinase [Streptomyces virginiae]MCI4080258.1 histidine kinase [Streptomyces sp. MMS21 TC-5]QNE28464.1 two-component sensor histidine kinase [Streptomyces sp. INR7]RST11199.1 two-component sensor histidine kinase [Streptomyces sp. WAC05950]
MYRLLRAPFRPVTYSRWLHLCVPLLLLAIWMFVIPEWPWGPMLLVLPFGLVPWVRLAEGLQAQFLLTPYDRGRAEGAISLAPSAHWGDRWRTVLWLETRMVIAIGAVGATVWMPAMTVELIATALGHSLDPDPLAPFIPESRWVAALLAPVPLVVLMVVVVLLGELITVAATRLLSPSAAERLSALEERTEQLLERTRIARELHDSIGHALTVAVVQAGAARAAGDPAFTDRALCAIEETGRAALEDLERVLGVLRESGQPPSQRPTLAEADRLLESARASGSEVDAQLTGPLEKLPGPVTREGYRILQEALTNVLRHCGPVPVRVRVEMAEDRLDLEVTNALPERPGVTLGGGSGLRGIRERAALLGGEAETGVYEGGWRVRARLPLERIR